MIGFVYTTPKFTVNALNFKLCMHLTSLFIFNYLHALQFVILQFRIFNS